MLQLAASSSRIWINGTEHMAEGTETISSVLVFSAPAKDKHMTTDRNPNDDRLTPDELARMAAEGGPAEPVPASRAADTPPADEETLLRAADMEAEGAPPPEEALKAQERAQAEAARRATDPAGDGPATAFAFDDVQGDAVVHEYERRYAREPYPDEKLKRDSHTDEMDARSGIGAILRETKRKREQYAPYAYNRADITLDERRWAAIAHASIWLSLFGAIVTFGISIPLSIFVPLVIHLVFRNRSEFVAFHALQAFVLQVVATLGVVALGVLGGVLWAFVLVIFALLSVVLIGIPLLFVWILIGIVFFVALTALPVIGLILGTIAALDTYAGRDHRYPYLGELLDRHLAGLFMRSA
jgi:hypothetical protein